MTTLQTSEILDLTADKIEDLDWRQAGGWYAGQAKGVCLEGGLMAVLGIQWQDSDAPIGDDENEQYDDLRICPAYLAVQEYLGDRLFTFTDGSKASLWMWNDEDTRTKDEVVEVLRGAAAVERVKEAALVPAAA